MPVSISHSALPMPTTRGSRWVPPSASDRPQRLFNRPSLAFSHDPEIAPASQLHAAGQTPAVDRRDGGLARVQTREAHRTGGIGMGMLPELGHSLEVRPRAEGLLAGAGDHQNLRRIVRGEPVDALSQFDRQLSIDVVVHLGTVQREQRDLVVLLDQKLCPCGQPLLSAPNL